MVSEVRAHYPTGLTLCIVLPRISHGIRIFYTIIIDNNGIFPKVYRYLGLFSRYTGILGCFPGIPVFRASFFSGKPGNLVQFLTLESVLLPHCDPPPALLSIHVTQQQQQHWQQHASLQHSLYTGWQGLQTKCEMSILVIGISNACGLLYFVLWVSL